MPSKSDRSPGTHGRHKAARPIQSRQIGKRPPQSPQTQSAAPRERRPVSIDDQMMITRAERRSLPDSMSQDDSGFEGNDR